MRRRRVTTLALALSFLATGLVLGASLISPSISDAAIGVPAAALAIATMAASILLRRPHRPVAAAAGTVAGLAVLFYAGLLLDPSPTDVPERPDLVFGLELVGLWVIAAAARIPRGRPIGVGGGLILVGSLGATLAAGSPPSHDGVVLLVALGALGSVVAGAWAAAVSAQVAAGLPLDARAADPRPGRPPTTLGWRWAVPMPDRVPFLLRIAGGAAIYDGVLRILAAPAVVATRPIEVVEAAFAAGWLMFVIVLRRAAPRIAAVTSTALELAGFVHLDVGLGWTAFAASVVLIPPASAFSDERLSPLELANAATILLAVGAARLAWVTRVIPRRLGVGVAMLWVGGAVAAMGVAGGSAPPVVAAGGAAFSGVTWIVFGAWLTVLARRLRHQRPLDAFRPPRGTLAIAAAAPAPAGRPAVRLGSPRDGAAPDSRRTARSTGPRHDRWPRAPSPTRFGVVDLAGRLGLTPEEVRRARPGYATFAVPKRSGGDRTIAAPDEATKALQRRILHRLLDRLPAHDAAHGFERHRSIVTNAARHRRPAVLVKLDIEDFFGRTRTVRIRRYWRVIGWDRESARILTRLTTWQGGLPQGAPTSPRLANLVNVRLDARLAGVAAVHGAAYTRYADDLTFSFATDDGAAVRQLIHAVRRVCHDEGRYELHRKRKVEIRRRHERQEITGLVVNDGPPRLSRERRRWLRAVEYRRYSGGSPTIGDGALKGWQALESMIDRQVAADEGRDTT